MDVGLHATASVSMAASMLPQDVLRSIIVECLDAEAWLCLGLASKAWREVVARVLNTWACSANLLPWHDARDSAAVWPWVKWCAVALHKRARMQRAETLSEAREVVGWSVVPDAPVPVDPCICTCAATTPSAAVPATSPGCVLSYVGRECRSCATPARANRHYGGCSCADGVKAWVVDDQRSCCVLFDDGHFVHYSLSCGQKITGVSVAAHGVALLGEAGSVQIALFSCHAETITASPLHALAKLAQAESYTPPLTDADVARATLPPVPTSNLDAYVMKGPLRAPADLFSASSASAADVQYSQQRAAKRRESTQAPHVRLHDPLPAAVCDADGASGPKSPPGGVSFSGFVAEEGYAVCASEGFASAAGFVKVMRTAALVGPAGETQAGCTPHPALRVLGVHMSGFKAEEGSHGASLQDTAGERQRSSERRVFCVSWLVNSGVALRAWYRVEGSRTVPQSCVEVFVLWTPHLRKLEVNASGAQKSWSRLLYSSGSVSRGSVGIVGKGRVLEEGSVFSLQTLRVVYTAAITNLVTSIVHSNERSCFYTPLLRVCVSDGPFFVVHTRDAMMESVLFVFLLTPTQPVLLHRCHSGDVFGGFGHDPSLDVERTLRSPAVSPALCFFLCHPMRELDSASTPYPATLVVPVPKSV